MSAPDSMFRVRWVRAVTSDRRVLVGFVAHSSQIDSGRERCEKDQGLFEFGSERASVDVDGKRAAYVDQVVDVRIVPEEAVRGVLDHPEGFMLVEDPDESHGG